VVHAFLFLLLFSQDRDLVVEPMSFTGSTQLNRPDVRSSSSPSNENLRARTSGKACTFLSFLLTIGSIIHIYLLAESISCAGSTSRSAPPRPPPTQTDSAVNPLRFDARTIHFSINAWVSNKPPFLFGNGSLCMPKRPAGRTVEDVPLFCLIL